MINYGKVKSTAMPQEIEITETKVFLASNVHEYEVKIDDHVLAGYEYEYVEYDKNEYLQLLAAKNTALQDELLDTQAALCDVYELVGGLA